MPSYLSFARFYDGLMQDACYEKHERSDRRAEERVFR